MSKFNLIQKFFQKYYWLLVLLFILIVLVFQGKFKESITVLGFFIASTVVCILLCDFKELEEGEPII